MLIALTIEEHEHHRRVSAWCAEVEHVAVCPVVESALVSFLVRIGEAADTATAALRLLDADPRCEFWPDSVSYVEADLHHVRGHRQVTDVAVRRVGTKTPSWTDQVPGEAFFRGPVTHARNKCAATGTRGR